jgi:hypothetical protein
VISNQTLVLGASETVKTFSGQSSSTETVPWVTVTNSTVSGADNLIVVEPGASTSLAGPLLNVTDSTINTNSSLLYLNGSNLASSATSPFLFVDPSTVTTGSNMLQLLNGSNLSLAGPLVSAQSASFTAGNPALDVSIILTVLDGSILTSTSTAPLLSFDASSFDGATVVSVRRSASTLNRSILALSGPLFSAVNESSFNTSSLGLGPTLGTTGGPCCSLISVTQGGQLSSTTTGPLIQVTGSTVNAGPDVQSGGSVINISDTFGGAPPTELVAPSSVTLVGPLLRSDNSTLTALFHLLRVGSSSLVSTTTDPLIQLNNSTVSLGGLDPFANATSTARVLNLSGTAATPGTLTLQGPLFRAVASNLTTTSDPFGIFAGGSLTQTGSVDPLILLSGGTLNSGATFIHARGFATGGSIPASLSLSGPLLTMSGTTMNITGNLLRLADGGSLSSTTTDPLISLTAGSFTGAPAGSARGGSLLRMFSEVGQSGTSLSIAGPYLISSGTAYAAPDASGFSITDGSFISSTGSGTFASFSGGSVSTAGSFVAMASNTSFTVPGQPTVFGNGVAPTFNLAGPFLAFNGMSVTAGNPTANTSTLMFIGDGSTLTSTGSAPLLSFDAANVDLAGGVISLRRSASVALPSKLTLSGPLFAATGSTFDTSSLGFGGTFGTPGNCCSSFFIGQGAQITSSTGSPLIQLANSTFSSGPDLQSGANIVDVVDTFGGAPAAELRAPASVGLSGPLLSASNSTITALFHLVNVGRSSLSSETQAALIQLSGATVGLGGVSPITQAGTGGRLLNLISSVPAGTPASPASISLNGPVLLASNSNLTMTGELIGIFNGATFNSSTSAPLVQLNGGTLSTTTASGFNGFVLDVGGLGGPTGAGFATATFGGPLLNGTGTLNLAGGLANIFGGGQVTTTGATDPFVLINGGAHTVASSPGFAMFRLFGRATATAADPETGLSLGTDRPIQGALQGDGTRPVVTPLLETSGATVTGQKIAHFDTLLLEATAPLLNLRANGSTQSVLTTTGTNAVDLSFQARVSALGSSLIRLDNSVLNVANGSLVNVNASKLSVAGDLVNLLNGATLSLINGPLITVAGNGFANITGGLINFGGTSGNTVNVTNTLCPCSLFGGVPVALQNGALATNVQISSPIKNPTLGTVNLSPNAALAVVNGAGSKLIVGPQ